MTVAAPPCPTCGAPVPSTEPDCFLCRGRTPEPVPSPARPDEHGPDCTACIELGVHTRRWGPCVAHAHLDTGGDTVAVCVVDANGDTHPTRHGSELWVDVTGRALALQLRSTP